MGLLHVMCVLVPYTYVLSGVCIRCVNLVCIPCAIALYSGGQWHVSGGVRRQRKVGVAVGPGRTVALTARCALHRLAGPHEARLDGRSSLAPS